MAKLKSESDINKALQEVWDNSSEVYPIPEGYMVKVGNKSYRKINGELIRVYKKYGYQSYTKIIKGSEQEKVINEGKY